MHHGVRYRPSPLGKYSYVRVRRVGKCVRDMMSRSSAVGRGAAGFGGGAGGEERMPGEAT